MRYIDIGEPVAMIAVFEGGDLYPYKFLWRNRNYKVGTIHGNYVNDDGMRREYFFAVTTTCRNWFELCFDSENMSWVLVRGVKK